MQLDNNQKNQKSQHGDTLIEVMLSISVFAIVSILSVNLMNMGINTAQRTLEATMARNAIDAQAESLRFIHNSYTAERGMNSVDTQFQKLWGEIKSYSSASVTAAEGEVLNNNFEINNYNSCDEIYDKIHAHATGFRGFVVNPRYIIPSPRNESATYNGITYNDLLKNAVVSSVTEDMGIFRSPFTYPRLVFGQGSTETTDDQLKEDSSKIYQKLVSAEGIWDVAYYSNESNQDRSEYYDFYIRTCWSSPGRNSAISTITTVVRLYNPEVIEE